MANATIIPAKEVKNYHPNRSTVLNGTFFLAGMKHDVALKHRETTYL